MDSGIFIYQAYCKLFNFLFLSFMTFRMLVLEF